MGRGGMRRKAPRRGTQGSRLDGARNNCLVWNQGTEFAWKIPLIILLVIMADSHEFVEN